MYKIIGANCTGKTKDLILKASETPDAIIVCKNPDRMREKAYSIGITNVEILGFVNSVPLGKPLFIDDLEEFAKTFYPGLSGYTLSCDK